MNFVAFSYQLYSKTGRVRAKREVPYVEGGVLFPSADLHVSCTKGHEGRDYLKYPVAFVPNVCYVPEPGRESIS